MIATTQRLVLEVGAERPVCRRTGERQFGFDEVRRLLQRRSRPPLRIDVCPWCRLCHLRGWAR